MLPPEKTWTFISIFSHFAERLFRLVSSVLLLTEKKKILSNRILTFWLLQLKTLQHESFYSIGHQILSKWYRRNGIFDGVLSTPYHQETMRLISGFESQAATLNNYQLVTNSCKLAIFCSFLLSKLGNKIVNSPKQLHTEIHLNYTMSLIRPWNTMI